MFATVYRMVIRLHLRQLAVAVAAVVAEEAPRMTTGAVQIPLQATLIRSQIVMTARVSFLPATMAVEVSTRLLPLFLRRSRHLAEKSWVRQRQQRNSRSPQDAPHISTHT